MVILLIFKPTDATIGDEVVRHGKLTFKCSVNPSKFKSFDDEKFKKTMEVSDYTSGGNNDDATNAIIGNICMQGDNIKKQECIDWCADGDKRFSDKINEGSTTSDYTNYCLSKLSDWCQIKDDPNSITPQENDNMMSDRCVSAWKDVETTLKPELTPYKDKITNFLQKYCKNVKPSDFISSSTGYMKMGKEKLQKICGCFMEQEIYDNFWNDLSKEYMIEGINAYNRECYFPLCQKSETIQPSGGASCPDCTQAIAINNEGTIKGDISIQQNAECKTIRKLTSIDKTRLRFLRKIGDKIEKTIEVPKVNGFCLKSNNNKLKFTGKVCKSSSNGDYSVQWDTIENQDPINGCSDTIKKRDEQSYDFISKYMGKCDKDPTVFKNAKTTYKQNNKKIIIIVASIIIIVLLLLLIVSQRK